VNVSSAPSTPLPVEAVRADHGQFPGEGPGFLHGKADGLRGATGGGVRDGEDGDRQQRTNKNSHGLLGRFLKVMFFSAGHS